MSIIHNDLLGSLFLLGLFGVTILCAEIWTRAKHPDPELTRKFVHIVGGLGCLLFPFFVESPLVVVMMACVFAAVFAMGQKSDVLQCLSGVGRKSRGSEYYPIAVAFLFYVSQGRWWLYFVSILILTLADAAAALIGARFGRLKYQVGENDTKSVEGSLIFLGVTFFVIAVLLRVLTGTDLELCLLVAFLVAVLLTGVEAISVHGTDNVFVPLLTCFVLLKITTKSVAEVRFQCLSMILIFIFLLALSRVLRLFSVRDFIIFFIFTYGTWTLGSVDWSIPVFICFAGYCSTRLITRNRNPRAIDTDTLLNVLMIPLSILLFANASGEYRVMYGPYLLAVLLPAVMGTWVSLLRATKDGIQFRGGLLLLFALAGSSVGWGASLFQSSVGWREVVILPLITLSVLIVYDRLIGGRNLEEKTEAWSQPILILALVGASIGYVLQSLHVVEVWNPRF